MTKRTKANTVRNHKRGFREGWFCKGKECTSVNVGMRSKMMRMSRTVTTFNQDQAAVLGKKKGWNANPKESTRAAV